MATVRYKTFFSGVVCVNKYSAKVRPHEKNFPSFLKVISVPCYGLTMCQFPLQPRPPRENLWLQFSLLFFSYTYFLGGVVNAISAARENFFLSNHLISFLPNSLFRVAMDAEDNKKMKGSMRN